MQQTTESTVSYTQAGDSEDRQSVIAYYVDQIIRRIAECPYDSIPQLFQHVTRGGPCQSQADVLRLFGGRIIFRQTCRRMNSIRRAALNGEMGTMPVDLRTWDGPERPVMDPPYTDYRYFWRPVLHSQTLFWYATDGMEEEICRYPAVLGTDDFFCDTEDESPQTDAATEGGDWFEALNPIGDEYFWGRHSEEGQTAVEEEPSEEGSDDEEWRQPPLINTSGPEWYYE